MSRMTSIPIVIIFSIYAQFAHPAEQVLIMDLPPSIACIYTAEDIEVIKNEEHPESELNDFPTLEINEVNEIFQSYVDSNSSSSSAFIVNYQIFRATATVQGRINLDWIYLLKFNDFGDGTIRAPVNSASKNLIITSKGNVLEVTCD